MPWLKFRIRKGFRYTRRHRFPDLPPDTGPGRIANFDNVLFTRVSNSESGISTGTREYSDVEGHPAYHCRLYNLDGAYDSFNYKRALRSDRHEERLYIQYKTCSCLSQKIKTAQVR